MTQIILQVDDLPNHATAKAMRNAKDGKVTPSKNSTDMFSSLGK